MCICVYVGECCIFHFLIIIIYFFKNPIQHLVTAIDNIQRQTKSFNINSFLYYYLLIYLFLTFFWNGKLDFGNMNNDCIDIGILLDSFHLKIHILRFLTFYLNLINEFHVFSIQTIKFCVLFHKKTVSLSGKEKEGDNYQQNAKIRTKRVFLWKKKSCQNYN